MVTKSKWFWPAALLTAWFADFLFWGKAPGISFPIWITVALLIGFLLSWREGQRPSAWSVLLAVLIVLFSTVVAFRSNGPTVMYSILMAGGGIVLLAATFLNGHWLSYRIVDYVTNGLGVMWGAVSRPFISLSTPQALPAAGEAAPQSPSAIPSPENPASVELAAAGAKRSAIASRRRAAPVIRGVIIAIPVLAVFIALFASADPVFNAGVTQILNIEKLPEYLLRLILIIILGFALVGVYLHAILPAAKVERPDTSKAWLKPFLGFTETGILLGALDVLFIIFVTLQIRYLFGGSANISETGFTYSQYAVRGFNELVWVATLSLLLFLVLSTITRLESKGTRIAFTALIVLLMANVLVILASSLTRLMLYESTYGFTVMRTLPHIFIFWLGGLVVAAAVLELLQKRGRFGLALLIAVVGFSATLAVMNVEGFIVRKNVGRAMIGESLDVNYLSTLSSDAVPAMVKYYNDTTVPAKVHEALGLLLACRLQESQGQATRPWQSYHFGQANAVKLLEANAPSLNQIHLLGGSNLTYFTWEDQMIYCNALPNLD